MTRHRFTVIETFTVPSRGLLVLLPAIPMGDEPGDAVLLKRPAGNAQVVPIYSLERPLPNPKHELLIVLKGLSKE